MMLTIEEWYGPFDKPKTMLTERDSSGNFLRRFDISGLEWVEAKAEAFSVEPPKKTILRDIADKSMAEHLKRQEEHLEKHGFHIGDDPDLKVVY